MVLILTKLSNNVVEIVRQTLIAAEKMKQNGDCIAESDLGSAAAVFASGGEGNG